MGLLTKRNNELDKQVEDMFNIPALDNKKSDAKRFLGQDKGKTDH
ncbi:hypothetical protein [Weissella halotolerans]|nr:hypothetical protein [Weissella halotolerans]